MLMVDRSDNILIRPATNLHHRRSASPTQKLKSFLRSCVGFRYKTLIRRIMIVSAAGGHGRTEYQDSRSSPVTTVCETGWEGGGGWRDAGSEQGSQASHLCRPRHLPALPCDLLTTDQVPPAFSSPSYFFFLLNRPIISSRPRNPIMLK